MNADAEADAKQVVAASVSPLNILVKSTIARINFENYTSKKGQKRSNFPSFLCYLPFSDLNWFGVI